MPSRVLESRKIKFILIAAGSLLAIYLAIGSWLNRIYISKQLVDEAWIVFKQNVDHRLELVLQWDAFIKHFRPESSVLLRDLAIQYQTAKHTKVTDKVLQNKEALQRFVNDQQSITHQFSLITTTLQGDTALANNPNFQLLKSELDLVQSQMIYTSKTLNQNIIRYNVSITEVPGSWVNLFLKYPLLFTFALEIEPESKQKS
jgi:hypothetical protein